MVQPISNSTLHTCSICLENVNKNPKILPCTHQFHQKCANRWLKTHNECPNCRKVVDASFAAFEELRQLVREEISSILLLETLLEGYKLEEAKFLPNQRVTRSRTAARQGIEVLARFLQENRNELT